MRLVPPARARRIEGSLKVRPGSADGISSSPGSGFGFAKPTQSSLQTRRPGLLVAAVSAWPAGARAGDDIEEVDLASLLSTPEEVWTATKTEQKNYEAPGHHHHRHPRADRGVGLPVGGRGAEPPARLLRGRRPHLAQPGGAGHLRRALRRQQHRQGADRRPLGGLPLHRRQLAGAGADPAVGGRADRDRPRPRLGAVRRRRLPGGDQHPDPQRQEPERRPPPGWRAGGPGSKLATDVDLSAGLAGERCDVLVAVAPEQPGSVRPAPARQLAGAVAARVQRRRSGVAEGLDQAPPPRWPA